MAEKDARGAGRGEADVPGDVVGDLAGERRELFIERAFPRAAGNKKAFDPGLQSAEMGAESSWVEPCTIGVMGECRAP